MQLPPSSISFFCRWLLSWVFLKRFNNQIFKNSSQLKSLIYDWKIFSKLEIFKVFKNNLKLICFFVQLLPNSISFFCRWLLSWVTLPSFQMPLRFSLWLLILKKVSARLLDNHLPTHKKRPKDVKAGRIMLVGFWSFNVLS